MSGQKKPEVKIAYRLPAKSPDNSDRTAIVRSKLSAPAQKLREKGLLTGKVLDFGSGRGFDAENLGFQAYDPYHGPKKMPRGRFDTVMLNYVLNTMQPGTRDKTLQRALAKVKPGGTLYATVRTGKGLGGHTGRGTWQGAVDLDYPVVVRGSGYKTYGIKKTGEHMLEEHYTAGYLSALEKYAAETVKRVATVALVKDGKVLMGRRKDNGKWTTPGGHLEDGESPLAGAVREVAEEAGLEVPESRLRLIRDELVTKKGGEKLRVYAFRCDVDPDEELATTKRFDPDNEVHRWVWTRLVDNQEILDNLHVPASENVLLKGLIGGSLEKEAVSAQWKFDRLLSGVRDRLSKTLGHSSHLIYPEKLERKLVSRLLNNVSQGPTYLHTGTRLFQDIDTAKTINAKFNEGIRGIIREYPKRKKRKWHDD